MKIDKKTKMSYTVIGNKENGTVEIIFGGSSSNFNPTSKEFGKTMQDWEGNGAAYLLGKSGNQDAALEAAREIQKRYLHGVEFKCTDGKTRTFKKLVGVNGHSKGGGEANYVASVLNLKSFTVDPAPCEKYGMYLNNNKFLSIVPNNGRGTLTEAVKVPATNAYMMRQTAMSQGKILKTTTNIVAVPAQNMIRNKHTTFDADHYASGKSAVENFKIDEYERVTFHPNYMYGHFVGAFKPFPRILKTANGDIKKDADGNIQETIVYEYVPGILMKQLIKALKNPDKNYLIIIEEINRSNVAAVFGDIFQLLDRNIDGNSEYDITTSRELQEYLKKELRGIYNERLGEDFSRLYLPFNLYIWATMNSADQGVMPLDTAFKRRWEFEYQGVDNLNEKDFENYEFKVNPSQKCNWNDYRKELNKRLSNLNIPEDKLIGPYFISKSILKKNIIELTKTIRNKLLMYLYEDVAKAFRSSLFAEGKYSTYSKLCEEFDKDALSIFRNKIEIETRDIISEKLKNTNEGENEKEINVAENLNN